MRAQILSDELLRPVFRTRRLLYVMGVVIAGLLFVVDGGHAALMVTTLLGLAVSSWQMRARAIHPAWLFDSAFAVAVAWLMDTPIGLAVVVGWAAVIGLVDTSRSWIFPAGSGVAAALTTALIEPTGFVWSAEALLRVGGVTAVAVFFVVMFRMVGDLIHKSEQELREFFERVPIALVRTNPEGKLLEFNRATAVMFEDPVIGEPVTDRYVDPAQRQSFIAKLMSDGVVHNHEVTFRTRPDETIEGVVSANAVRGDDGALRYIESAIYDFTSLRRTEIERERLARVIDSTSDLVAISNFDGSIRYANAAARAWLHEYVTDDDYAHLGQTVIRKDYVTMREALRSDGSWVGVVAIPGREGERIVSVSLQKLERGGEYTVAAICRDVTDEVETERQLKDLIRAKDELVASISHEIRTPLSVVLGLASELRDNYIQFDAGTHQEFATLIAEQGQEMANIVEDLLVAARADAGSIVLAPDAVDIGKELEATLRSLPEQDRPMIVDRTSGAKCWGDANRIRQILRNLIVNACRYGGERIVVTARTSSDLLYLDVMDDGPGVPEDQVANIFEPFKRAHSAATQPASIGLGLSVSRDLAHRMGGSLEYARSDGQTVFTLHLPVAESPANRA